MRVLDIGSGAGDVSFLVADLVGAGGPVLGVDQNPEVVRAASSRAAASGLGLGLGLKQVSFAVGNIRDVVLDGEFDAVVGRLVLMYSCRSP